MSQLFQELKRRNVFRVALAYLAVSWLILQAADIVLDNIAAPAWLMQALMFFMVAGFPVAILFAWAFEMTPEGIRKEADVDRSTSITDQTGKKLNRVIIGVLVAAVLFLLTDKFVLQPSAPVVTTTDRSVAVLPFIAMSRGPDDEYFADGLTEEILNSLTRLPALLVTARTSSFHFKGKDIPIPEIAATLGVEHVVEGSVRRDGGRLRITAQLIRAADGFHLWSENYDRDSDDTFAVQTDIAEKIAVALDVIMDDEQRKQMLETGVRNPEAFVAFQKGIELFEKAHGSANLVESLRQANEHFDRALQIEPGFSDAYLWGADYYTHILIDSIINDAITDEIRDAALQKTVEYHENASQYATSEADRVVPAFDLAVITGQWRKLPTLLDDLFAAPGCVGAGWSLEVSNPYGRAEESLRAALHETECNPIGFSGWNKAIAASITLGEVDAAIEIGLKAQATSPHIRIHQQLVFAYLADGRFADAEAVIDRYIDREDQSVPMRAMLAAARGDEESVSVLVERNFEIASDLPRPPLVQLSVSGDRDAANKMAAEIDALPFGYLVLMIYPQTCRCGAPFDLEATPNFAKLVEEAGFQWPPASPINWPLKDW